MNGHKAKEQRQKAALDELTVVRTIKVHVAKNGMVFAEGFQNNLYVALETMAMATRAISEFFVRAAQRGEVSDQMEYIPSPIIQPETKIITPH